MRVVMISKACVIGIYQRKLEELAKFPDIELTLIVPPDWIERGRKIELERAHTDGYRIIVQPIFFNGRYHLHFYPGLGSVLRQLRPEILHIDEEPYNLATFQAMRVARGLGARRLFFAWQNLHRGYPPPFGWIEGYNLRHSDLAMAGTQGAAQVLRAKGFAKPIEIIPQFGVDLDLFKPDEATASQRRAFTIGYVGRLVKEKGVEVLLRAVAGLGGDWELRVLGRGPETPHLVKVVSDLGIARKVSFDPPRPSLAMPEYYRQLDLLVLPSRTQKNWVEQFGRVLIEAMACGVPVLGSDAGEIPNVIGEAGLIVPEGSVEATRDAMQRLRADPELRRRLTQLGRQRVLAHYSMAQVAAETYRVYRTLIDKPPSN